MKWIFGAIVQWQDRQYVGSLWGQNQGIPHVLSMSNPYPAQPHKISSFCLWGIYWSYLGIMLRACWLQQAVSTQHVHSISDWFNMGKILNYLLLLKSNKLVKCCVGWMLTRCWVGRMLTRSRFSLIVTVKYDNILVVGSLWSGQNVKRMFEWSE